MQQEIWQVIPGFPFYEASNEGGIRSVNRSVSYKDGRKNRQWPSKIIKGYLSSSGYKDIDIKICGKRFKKQIHRLIAETFIPNPNSKKQVNHRDNDKLNNKVDNLEWVSQSENMKHAFDNGFHSGKGKTHYKARRVKNEDTGQEFDSINLAAEAMMMHPQKMFRILKGHQKGPFIYI